MYHENAAPRARVLLDAIHSPIVQSGCDVRAGALGCAVRRSVGMTYSIENLQELVQ
jgi:hypothetical protein